jgi:hypothetical protein
MSSTRSESGGRVVIGCAALFIAAVAIFLLSIVGFFFHTGAREMHRQARLMDAAVEVEATIISSEVVRSAHVTRTGTGAGAGSTSRREIHTPKIVFAYTFDGRPRRGDRIHPAPRGGDERWARRMTTRYRPGETVTAWVDPGHPEDAFLEKEWVLGPYGMILAASIGLAMLMAMAAVVLFLWPAASRGAAAVGVAGGVLGPLYAGSHYWMHPRADATDGLLGGGTLAIIALVTLVIATLPLLARLQGRRWQRKLAGADTASPPPFDDEWPRHPPGGADP